MVQNLYLSVCMTLIPSPHRIIGMRFKKDVMIPGVESFEANLFLIYRAPFDMGVISHSHSTQESH